MKLTIPRPSLTAILKALAGVAADGTVTIDCDLRLVTFTRTGSDSQLSVISPTASADEDGSATVPLDALKGAIAKTRTADAVCLRTAGHVLHVLHGETLVDAIPLAKVSHEKPFVPKDAETIPLPTGFASFVLSAIPMASKDKTRPALTGISLSSRGIAASDGKQLYNLPLPLRLKEGLILPNSPVLPHLAGRRWTHLAHWRDTSGARRLAVLGDGFRLVMKSIQGDYPPFWNVIPDAGTLDACFAIRGEGIARAMEFLKRLPTGDEGEIRLWFLRDRLVMQDNGMEWTAVPVENHGPAGRTAARGEYLLRALQLGHATFRTSSRAPSPILAGGGAGTYLWMPLRDEIPAEPPAESLAASLGETSGRTTAPAPCANAVPQTVQPPAKASTTPQPTKEKNTMVTTATTTAPVPAAAFRNFVSNAVQPRTPAAPTIPVPQQPAPDPLTEAAIAIAEIRSTVEALESRLQDAGRRLREAVVLQKQKERAYQDATRKLDRIRMAV